MTTRTVIFSNESLSKLQDRDKCIGTCSGIARFFDAWNEQTRWPPLTEITNLKKIIIIIFFVEFPYVCRNNLKFTEGRNRTFSISNVPVAPPWTVLCGAATPLTPP